MASMFIALILWLICKWEEDFDQKDNQRWIILIFFITGLSLGVHMMCMLAVPAVCLIYYTKNINSHGKVFISKPYYFSRSGNGIQGCFPMLMTIFSRSEITFCQWI